MPLDLSELSQASPIYNNLPGWMADTTGTTKFEDLPENARNYLNYIADYLGVTICIVSTGAKRKETIVV